MTSDCLHSFKGLFGGLFSEKLVIENLAFQNDPYSNTNPTRPENTA